MSEQKQHMDYHRKIALRKNLIEKVGKMKGACYVPFCGDGDLAVDLYLALKKPIYGADLDGDRVKTAQARLPDAEILQADCDAFPFRGRDIKYSLADFDPYAYPYKAFREFWKQAELTSPCVLYFTDGEKQAVIRSGHWTAPNGKKVFTKGVDARRVIFNKYWVNTILPWFTEFIKPWQIIETSKYLRRDMLYWGAIIEKPKLIKKRTTPAEDKQKPRSRIDKFDSSKKEHYIELLRNGNGRTLACHNTGISLQTLCNHRKKDKAFAEAESKAERLANEKIVNALYEAALSGNVTAIQVWLYNRLPGEWADKRNIQLAGEGRGPITLRVVYDNDNNKQKRD